MSDNSQTKNPKPSRTIVISLFAAVALIGLVYYVTAGHTVSAPADLSERAVAGRIQKIGVVQFAEASHEPKSGEDVFKGQCTACHTAGVVGAPKFADAAAWAPRIATGFDALLNSALKGKNAMPAQGGGGYQDLEIARAVVYMANAGGAKFEAPAAPAPAASAPEAVK
jgi:cytochrome c5